VIGKFSADGAGQGAGGVGKSVILPDTQYYSQLEKAQMAKAEPFEAAEEANDRESELYDTVTD
jgi:hypothetical protein